MHHEIRKHTKRPYSFNCLGLFPVRISLYAVTGWVITIMCAASKFAVVPYAFQFAWNHMVITFTRLPKLDYLTALCFLVVLHLVGYIMFNEVNKE